MTDKLAIEWYWARNYELIPIHPDHGKRPRDSGWRDRSYDHTDLMTWAAAGYNLGVRLGPNDLIIDVDPRNGGALSLEMLERRHGFLRSLWPVVATGGGGWHIYMRHDGTQRLRELITEYPGIEFKKHGKQVVAAGSKHPETGLLYAFQPDHLEKTKVLNAPRDLLADLQFDGGTGPSVYDDQPTTTNEQLALLLSYMPIEEYDTNDTWTPVMISAYNATKGQGLDVFLAWSLGDPKYSEHAAIITQRWRSLGRG